MNRRPRQHQNDLAQLAAGRETGFWDDHGQPAPWPDDLDEWRPTTSDPVTRDRQEPPF
jgi:hypothetical protein